MIKDDKKSLSEEDIKLRYITPAITEKGWALDNIRMEYKVHAEKDVQITDGKVNINGNIPSRGKKMFADYLLLLNPANPIAIVEAKDANRSISHGMQQAKEYATKLDVKFAYSSNGEGFSEFDFITGKERTFKMSEFPTPDELCGRFFDELCANGLTEDEKKIIEQPFCTGQGINSPRYYQRIAINRVLSAIAKGQGRVLLVMATGTGKTFTAFQIVWRLLKSGLKKKILYLADRNILVDQSIQQDFRPLENVIHKVDYSKDKYRLEEMNAYQVYFALYQQLIGQNDAQNYKELFPNPDYFDLVIVDECHRGSAKDDSNWRNILEYFKSATHFGMTATPKETRYQSSIGYFGKPVYKYSLKDGIEDGFLAPFRVINVKTNIGDGWRPTKGQKDIYGIEIPDQIYNDSDYDYKIVILDRINAVAKEITDYLKNNNHRMDKTIVFCADEEHAERMRVALTNLNSDMMKINPDYVVRITGSDDYGKRKLDEFISVNAKYPVIATTSKLLSTGVDCKMVKLIALDQQIGSMTEFKQIIGRGTRLRYSEGKTHFTIMDFRNATRLFADPDFDGDPIPVGDRNGGSGSSYPLTREGGSTVGEPGPTEFYKATVDKEGCEVNVISKIISTVDAKGKLLHVETVVDYTKKTVTNEFATIDNFVNKWNTSEKKSEMSEMLKNEGINLQLLKKTMNMEEVDDFDFICHIAYGKKTLTRRERANAVKKRDVFSKYGEQAQKVINALLEKYAQYGVTELENLSVLKTDPFRQLGSPASIIKLFGSRDGYIAAVNQLKQEIYNIA